MWRKIAIALPVLTFAFIVLFASILRTAAVKYEFQETSKSQESTLVLGEETSSVDYFLAYPGAAADADPFFGEENRVNRGGGWFDGEEGEVVATYNRNAGPPDISANDDIGFRCARDAQ